MQINGLHSTWNNFKFVLIYISLQTVVFPFANVLTKRKETISSPHVFLTRILWSGMGRQKPIPTQNQGVPVANPHLLYPINKGEPWQSKNSFHP